MIPVGAVIEGPTEAISPALLTGAAIIRRAVGGAPVVIGARAVGGTRGVGGVGGAGAFIVTVIAAVTKRPGAPATQRPTAAVEPAASVITAKGRVVPNGAAPKAAETLVAVAGGGSGREATTVVTGPVPEAGLRMGAVTGVGGVHVGRTCPAMAVAVTRPSAFCRGREIIRLGRHGLIRGRKPLPRLLGVVGAVTGVVRLTVPGRARLAEGRFPAILLLRRLIAVALKMVIGPHDGVPAGASARGTPSMPVRCEAVATPLTEVETGGR